MYAVPADRQRSIQRELAEQVPLGDDEIVMLVKAGDTQMFAVLMHRYHQRLYRVVRAILQNEADAEDAVQQAYVSAYRHLKQFEGRAQFSTWLTRIAIFEALSRRRRRDTRVDSGDDEVMAEVKSTSPDPERLAYVGELGVLLDSALARLPEAYRVVFTARELEGMSTTETAERLRLSEGAVKTRLHRARLLLQRHLRAVKTPVPSTLPGFLRPGLTTLAPAASRVV